MSILSDKAQQNLHSASHAYSNSRYCVAISRYYYNLLIRAKQCVIITKGYPESAFENRDAHTFIISELLKIYNSKNMVKRKIRKLYDLREHRRKAEYRSDVTYDLRSYNDVKKIIDELIQTFSDERL